MMVHMVLVRESGGNGFDGPRRAETRTLHVDFDSLDDVPEPGSSYEVKANRHSRCASRWCVVTARPVPFTPAPSSATDLELLKLAFAAESRRRCDEACGPIDCKGGCQD